MTKLTNDDIKRIRHTANTSGHPEIHVAEIISLCDEALATRSETEARMSDEQIEAIRNTVPEDQQRLAWLSVAEALNEHLPEWHKRYKGSGAQKAVAAIRELSVARSAATAGDKRERVDTAELVYRLQNHARDKAVRMDSALLADIEEAIRFLAFSTPPSAVPTREWITCPATGQTCHEYCDPGQGDCCAKDGGPAPMFAPSAVGPMLHPGSVLTAIGADQYGDAEPLTIEELDALSHDWSTDTVKRPYTRLLAMAYRALSTPSATAPITPSPLAEELMRAACIGMSAILARCGPYESLSPYLKARYKELQALHRLADEHAAAGHRTTNE